MWSWRLVVRPEDVRAVGSGKPRPALRHRAQSEPVEGARRPDQASSLSVEIMLASSWPSWRRRHARSRTSKIWSIARPARISAAVRVWSRSWWWRRRCRGRSHRPRRGRWRLPSRSRRTNRRRRRRRRRRGDSDWRSRSRQAPHRPGEHCLLQAKGGMSLTLVLGRPVITAAARSATRLRPGRSIMSRRRRGGCRW